jgi:hypothetical protein
MSKTKKQYWIIDTGTKTLSNGHCDTRGPYRTIKQAESSIIAENQVLHQESCNCLRRNEDKTPWGDTYHIVQVVRSVTPILKSIATLKDV